MKHNAAGKSKAEVVEAVHDKLRSVAAALGAGELPLGSFVITKQLTKRPDDYPDARAQPHVQVRLRGGGCALLCVLVPVPHPACADSTRA
jgi:DNA polymerase alpha subunit A